MSQRYVGGILSVGRDGINSPGITSVEYLVVSGGGGGGTGTATGGGGGGGLLTGTGYPVTIGTAITVTVGAGNPRDANSVVNGGVSSFGNIAPVGGGNGGAQGSLYGVIGGSGCGGNYNDPAQQGTPGQGNAGGLGSGTYYYVGGGGGGAGSTGRVGQQGSAGGGYQRAGAGGAGLVSTITGTPVYYSGGGGGGIYECNVGTPSAPGGTGGGGSGIGREYTGIYIRATDGLPNTGGGAGASGNNPPAQGPSGLGGNGGSGIVVIRYPSYLPTAASTTGSPETYIKNGWRVYKFFASGTITF